MAELVYWDSDCFLGWLLSEPDKRDFCAEVIQEAEDGKLTIVTSALTLAEVLAIRYQPKIPSTKKELVERFFKNDWIAVRPLTRRVSEKARELVWDHGIAPKDACHVASALSESVGQLHTFDRDLIGKSEKVGGDPLLRIVKPQVKQPRLQFGAKERNDDQGKAAE
ncbi:MAG: type II toxin-antitoxin system VapC family toxin [Aquamicrobium sp.]|uniref:type II toxin-antitoxin system VapC family toxin n=1 Tax=Aquamicrobium sp. TaxID=1872579 RepID=UPI00349EE4CB|nr:type II toxin-antitoxin system VapC family toxin [Aquamicrobium sp.]